MSNTGSWHTSTSEREMVARARAHRSKLESHRQASTESDGQHRRHRKIITSDPYVTVSVPQATVARTRVIKNSSDPIWNEHFGPSDPSFDRRSKLRSTTSSTSSPTAPPSTMSSDPSSSPTAALNHELTDHPVERRMACFTV
ncbi:phospholipase D delta-like [Fagus crenata]